MKQRTDDETDTSHEFTSSVPVKLKRGQRQQLDDLKESTGLGRSTLMRVGYCYFLDMVKRGKVDIFKLLKKENANGRKKAV